jgi:hypothetical protein
VHRVAERQGADELAGQGGRNGDCVLRLAAPWFYAINDWGLKEIDV